MNLSQSKTFTEKCWTIKLFRDATLHQFCKKYISFAILGLKYYFSTNQKKKKICSTKTGRKCKK